MTMPLPEICDPELPVLEAIAQGDRYAFEELAKRHNDWVRGVIYGVLGDSSRVDDVAQQVWTNVWERAKHLRDTKRWRPWLYRMARNAAVDAGREQSKRRRGAQKYATVVVDRGVDAPTDVVANDERHATVLEAIRSLPALYREPFVLRHMQEWSYGQIAEVMDLPVDTVETRLVRARRLLRETLRDKV